MKTAIIACKTLEDEVNKVIHETQCDFPVYWLESGLHHVTEKLHLALSLKLDHLVGYDRILLAYGFCGGAVSGLSTKNFQLILPRVEDCITLLLGSAEIRKEIQKAGPAYFLTKGWLDGERNIWIEYQYTVEKYGQKRGSRIFEAMFGNYKRLGIIDTGGYRICDIEELSKIIAAALRLKYDIIPGSCAYLSQLITGPWTNDRFITVPPNSRLDARNFS